MALPTESVTLRRLLAAISPSEAERLLQELQGGGFTVSIHGESVPSHGYMVSTASSEEKVPHGTLTVDELVSYTRRHEAELQPAHRYLGGWVDEGYDYIDVSDWFSDRAEAVAAGYDRRQVAIFDLASMESIYMNPDGPQKASAAAHEKAAALGTSTTPPEGVSPRLYWFAAADGSDCDAEGIAAHVGEVREIFDAAK